MKTNEVEWDGPTDSDGEPCIYVNYYACAECGTEWDDRWSCACDDECPSCGTDMTPYDSDEYSFELGKWITKGNAA